MRRGDGLILKGKSWYLEARIGGKRYQKRLGKGITRKIALELAQVVRGQILKGELGIGGKKKKDLSFSEARKRFEDWMHSDKKPNTIRSYAACLRALEKTFGGQRLGQISTWQVEAYRQKRSKGAALTERPDDLSDIEWNRRCQLAQRGAPIRVNRELAVLKMLFNRCRDWNLYEGENPVSKVKFRKEPRRRLRFLEAEETDRLLAACAEPLKTLVLVGINCGLRIHAEALTLRWENVDLKRATLSVESAYAKNHRSRSIPLNSTVKAALANLQKTAKSDLVFAQADGLPFRSIKTAFATACRKAKITDCTPHTLRHTFCSRLVMSGADLRTVQELGGWQTIGMVERYSHLSQAHKAEAVERIGVEFPYGMPYPTDEALAVVS
ncbi:MAG: site-specific integrase [Nitrospirae bacterium]|nr:site-specific integrase [Nitrospirota bacterium]